MSRVTKLAALAAFFSFGVAIAPPALAWTPTKPIEFIATAGPGGGTDNFARAVQGIITKYKLVDQPIVVVNKAGGSGAEGYVYGKAWPAIPTSWCSALRTPGSSRWCPRSPLITPISRPSRRWCRTSFCSGSSRTRLTRTSGDYLKAVAQAAGRFQDGRRAVQGHRRNPDAHDREGGEREIHLHSVQERRRSRRAARRRPYRLPRQQSERKHRTVEGRHAAPAVRLQPASGCRTGPRSRRPKAGTTSRPASSRASTFAQFQQPRTVWLPGKVTADQAAFYVDLMKKVQATPEWKEYIEQTSQTDTFLTGDAISTNSSRTTSSTSARSPPSRAG